MKRGQVAALFLLGLVATAQAAFSDVPPGPLAEQVERVVAVGWMQGYPDGTFRGQEPLNRYQLAGALGRVLKDLGVEAKAVSFSDVPKGHWAAEPLALAVSWGLISGYPDGTFRGQESLSRAALAVVLSKMLERLGVVKEGVLPWDVPPGHWAAGAVRRVLGAGVMDLHPDGSFGLDAKVNRYQLVKALAALQPLVETRRPGLGRAPQPSVPGTVVPSGTEGGAEAQAPGASGVRAEVLELPGRWVGTARGRTVVVGEKVLLLQGGAFQEIGPAPDASVVLPPWVWRSGALQDGKQRYVPLGSEGGKGVLPPILKAAKEAHLALDPTGNYLLLVNDKPLCACPSRVVRLVLLLASPVGLYAEYVYLLDDPGARVVGAAWPEPRHLLVMEASAGKTRVYRVNLNAGEDIAFSVWDEGGLEERDPLPVKPVAKVLLAELPLAEAWGLGVEAPDRLLTTSRGKVLRVHLPSALW